MTPMFEKSIRISVPIESGYIRYSALCELVDALDGMPDNVLIEVLPDELRFEEIS